MDADAKQPLKTTAVGFYSNPTTDPECVYSQFSIAWQFDNYIMSFENSEIPRPQEDLEGWGVYFLGPNGTLQINRMGYAVRPDVAKTQRKQGPLPIPGAGNVQGVGAQAPGAAGAQAAGGRGGGREGAAERNGSR